MMRFEHTPQSSEETGVHDIAPSCTTWDQLALGARGAADPLRTTSRAVIPFKKGFINSKSPSQTQSEAADPVVMSWQLTSPHALCVPSGPTARSLTTQVRARAMPVLGSQQNFTQLLCLYVFRTIVGGGVKI